MFCRANNQYLTWGKVPLGLNMIYTSDPAVKKTHFRLPDNQEREILTGELFALGIGGGEAFLRYAERTIGINLEWENDPKKCFEWKILGLDGRSGKPIATGSPVAIVNKNVKPDPDFFIYLDRGPGGGADIGWTTSSELWDKVLDFAAKKLITEAKEAFL
jgi:hypothetical protein